MKLLKILIFTFIYFIPCNNHAMGIGRAFGKAAVDASAKYMPQLIQNTITPARTKIASALTGTSAALANCFKKAAKAEHYYTKENGEQLTNEEHAVAYDAMLNHQFPMAPYYNKEYDPTKNETEQIQKELDQKAPGVKAHWIPTTVYELLHIKDANQREESKFATKVFPRKVNENSFQTEQSFLETNRKPRFFMEHARFNEVINNHVKRQLPQYNEKEGDYWKGIAWSKFEPPKNECQLNERETINAAIDWEVKNKNTSLYPLYRGGFCPAFFPPQIRAITQQKKDKLYDELYNVSVSYGNSLFAGHYHDKGACVAEFIRKSDMGYVLPIDKTNNEQQKWFFLPPLTTIVGLFCQGELFHPRTKLLSKNKDIDGRSIRGIWRIRNGKIPNYLITHIANESEAKEKILQRQKYLIENAVPLTNHMNRFNKGVREILAARNAKKAGGKS